LAQIDELLFPKTILGGGVDEKEDKSNWIRVVGRNAGLLVSDRLSSHNKPGNSEAASTT